MGYELRYPDVNGLEAMAPEAREALAKWVYGIPRKQQEATPKVLRSTRQWANKRRRVFERDGYRCTDCGKAGVDINDWESRRNNPDFVPLTLDHIVPRSKGGTNSIKNLQTMCQRCNGRKGNSLTAEAVRLSVEGY